MTLQTTCPEPRTRTQALPSRPAFLEIRKSRTLVPGLLRRNIPRRLKCELRRVTDRLRFAQIIVHEQPAIRHIIERHEHLRSRRGLAIADGHFTAPRQRNRRLAA